MPLPSTTIAERLARIAAEVAALQAELAAGDVQDVPSEPEAQSISVKEAAFIAGRSGDTILRWCHAYRLGRQVGGRWFIDPGRLREHLRCVAIAAGGE